MADDDQLSAQAEAFGVETTYYDALGTQRSPGEDALREIVNVLESHAKEMGATATPPVRVVRKGRDNRLDNVCGNGGAWRLVDADHEVAHGTCDDNAIALPAKLRVGSYRLLAGKDAGDGQPVIVAPAQSYQPAVFDNGKRVWALAVQLYSLRSRRNWGIGDFTDLKNLVRIAGQRGAAGIGLNPLHAISLDDPGMISPYSPTSRLFLNVLYVDVEAAPEFPGLAAAGLAEEVERLRASEFVDYAGITAAKLKGLRLAYEAFRERGSPERREDFAAFKNERALTLGGFAAFATLHRKFGPPWWNWPPEWHNPTAEKIDELWRIEAVEMDFHAYMQWLADRQLKACFNVAKRLKMPVGLYLDVAVGVSANSADVWSNQGAYVRELSAGAPPDMLNTFGQDWGLASLHPRVLAHTDFQLMRETLRAIMRYAGAIRIDHVLGFNRLYMIPHGYKPFEGTYVRFPLEAMLAVLAQESNAERCIVVGEDLGTVPDGFREKLADWNVWSYRVMIFEREHDGSFKPPSAYPVPTLVSFGTHDLPTFSGWLSNHDLAVKRSLDMDPGETEADRETAHRAMAAALSRECGSEELSTLEMIRFLARTPSRLLVVAAEDVFDVADQVNIPGTIYEHPNWRRRLPVSLEDFAADARLSAIAEVLSAEGRAVSSSQGSPA
ncbi:MAG: 4-alpha-glucanotransferase [Xanthobacteraceae bacterium]